MKRVQTILKSWIETDRYGFIRTFLLSEGFGFCLCLSFICGYCLDRYDSVSDRLAAVLLIVLLSGTVMGAVFTFYHACRRLLDPGKLLSAKKRDMKMHPDDKVSWKVWVISTVLILICWSMIWMAYYPVIFAYDADTQLSQSISRVYSTHHPLIHTLWLGGCMKLLYDVGGINAGMALYAATQMVIMAVISGWTISEAVRRGIGKIPAIVYGVFLAVFPVHGILAVSVTKDVVFSGLVLLFVMLVLRSPNAVILRRNRVADDETREADESRKNTFDISLRDAGDKSLIIKIAVCTAGMCLFRNNAAYALALMIVILFIRQLGKQRSNRYYGLIVAVACGIIAGSLINFGLKAVLHAESGSPREAMSIPIQQMARVRSLYGPELSPGTEEAAGNDASGNSDTNVHVRSVDPDRILDTDTCAAIDKLLSENAYWLYNEHLADPVKKEVNLKDPKLFVTTWLKLLPKYPGAYLDAWLLTTEGAWYIYDTSVNEIYGTGGGYGYLSTETRSMPAGFQVEPAPVLPGLRDALERLVTDNAFQGIPVVRLIFSPALYVWINSAYIYGALVRRRNVCALSGLLMVTYFITVLMGPAILVRYMYPYMIAVILPLMGYNTEN